MQIFSSCKYAINQFGCFLVNMAKTFLPKASRAAQYVGLRYASTCARLGPSRLCANGRSAMLVQPTGQTVYCHRNSRELLGILRRQLSTSAACFGVDYSSREGRMLRKLMSGSRKRWFDSEKKVEIPRLGGSDFLKPAKAKNPRRVHVLNAVLIKYVTDLLGSDEVIPDISGRGIEITKVKINQDYTCLNIYWMTSKHNDSLEIERLLNSNAGKLRSFLCQHNVIGNVPYIFFVKDDYQKYVSEVEALLAKADFGDDFQPKDPAHHLKTNAILKQSLPDLPELKDLEIEENHERKGVLNLEETDGGCLIADSTTTNKEMRMDILGVKHDAILAQVQKKLNQSLAAHRMRASTDSDGDGVALEAADDPEMSRDMSVAEGSSIPVTSKRMSSSEIGRFLQQQKKQMYLERKRKARSSASEESLHVSAFDQRDSQYVDIEEIEPFFHDDYDNDDYFETDGNYDVNDDYKSG